MILIINTFVDRQDDAVLYRRLPSNRRKSSSSGYGRWSWRKKQAKRSDGPLSGKKTGGSE
jgi:hypothetical protein